MNDEQLTELLADRSVEKRALAIIRANRMHRAAEKNGEVSYVTACKCYGVSYEVLRSIKSRKRLKGARGHINAKELSAYMANYSPWGSRKLNNPKPRQCDTN